MMRAMALRSANNQEDHLLHSNSQTLTPGSTLFRMMTAFGLTRYWPRWTNPLFLILNGLSRNRYSGLLGAHVSADRAQSSALQEPREIDYMSGAMPIVQSEAQLQAISERLHKRASNHMTKLCSFVPDYSLQNCLCLPNGKAQHCLARRGRSLRGTRDSSS